MNKKKVIGMELTHIDGQGNATMVDVGDKASSQRTAVATGCISMNQAAFSAVEQGTAKKGDVLTVAQIAGIMGAKQTADLIPLCHRLNLTHSKVEFRLEGETRSIWVTCTVRCQGQTGVEMEALTGATVALLAIYDMCKAVDRSMVISSVHLVEKQGGKSGNFRFEDIGHEG